MSSPASRIQANLTELFEANIAPGNAYIKFQLNSEITALLSMAQVQKSLIAKAEQITPLPSMPRSVIGMINSGDRVFCVFDLAKLLGLSSELTNSQQYQIIVLQTVNEPSIFIGLAISQLQGIIRFTRDKVQSSVDDVHPSLSSCLAGVLPEADNVIPILELERLLKLFATISPN